MELLHEVPRAGVVRLPVLEVKPQAEHLVRFVGKLGYLSDFLEEAPEPLDRAAGAGGGSGSP